MDKSALHRRLIIAGFVGFTLVMVAVFSHQGWLAARARGESREAYMVREKIQTVFAKLKDIEIGQRGYLLSGDSSYLASYFAATMGKDAGAQSSLWEELDTLRALVANRPFQSVYVDSLERLARWRAALARNMIEMREERGAEAAAEEIRRGEGKRVMNDVRALVETMLERENTVLRERTQAEDGNLRRNSWILYAVVALFYLAWMYSIYLARRSRSRRITAERDLRESHALLQAVVDSSTRGLITTGLDGRVQLFNPAAERMLGYSASEVVGRRAVEVLAGIHDREEFERRRQRVEAVTGGPVRGIEVFRLAQEDAAGLPDPAWTMIRRDGSRFITSLSVTLLQGRDGTRYGYLAVFQDVTERRMLQRRLAESNAMFEAVLNGTTYAIFATDAEGRLTVFNRAAERMLGTPAEAALGHKAMDLLHDLEPAEVEARATRIKARYGRAPEGLELFTLKLEEDEPFGQEWTFKNDQDGRDVPLLLSVSEMRDEQGRLIGHVALGRDITEVKANERIKKEFISTVSHELRTPLTSIRGALGLIAGGAAGELPDRTREMIAIAYRNSERLVHIINDILDIDKIESGRLTLHAKPLETGELLRQAVEVNRPYGDKHKVVFELGAVPENVWVMADPERLIQVMSNLLSNAAKFSPEGSAVRVSASVGLDTVRISVIDHGMGIPEGFRSRMFEKFAQAEGTDTRRYEGTGLGLNISKKLVELMNGTISFETETGKGTTFHVDLPLAAVPVTPAAILPSSRGRILVCEDDADVASLLRLLLEGAGFVCDIAPTLADARRCLQRAVYDALTLDLTLPDGNGISLLRELRAMPALAGLPVVVVSARADEGRHEFSGGAIGMVDWITKPIDEATLVGTLERAVSGTSGRPRVLHVEDDADLRAILARAMQDKIEWVGAGDLAEAETRLREARFDLVVLDLDLPDGSGLTLLECLRAVPGGPIPVLVLSASEIDNGVRARVQEALVKSRLSEERVVETILSLIRSHQRPETRT